jgi:hypothetical protein
MRIRFHSVLCLLALALGLLASGCAMFHGWGQVSSPGTPRFGASVDVPIGNK